MATGLPDLLIMATRGCTNNPDIFCYICGRFVVQKQRQKITDFVKKMYHAYFGRKFGDQDKSWAPHTVCRTCVESLRTWSKGRKKSLNFGVPMIWREPKDHTNDCYFCTVNIDGYNMKNKEISYPNLQSALRPIKHGANVPIPSPQQLEKLMVESESDSTEAEDDTDCYKPGEAICEPQLFTQSELNNLIRDLDLPKDCRSSGI